MTGLNRLTQLTPDDIMMGLTATVVLFLTVILPTIVIAIRKGNPDKFVRRYVPWALFLSAEAGVVVTASELVEKLVVMGIIGPVALAAGYGSYPIYRLVKRLLKQ
ncbi:MAG: hypothetical protein HY535_04145 [Chloroflexi bacterium]|nr:hypothetical protein [Chloroflexota bacterium]